MDAGDEVASAEAGKAVILGGDGRPRSLVVAGITKAFGTTRANDDVALSMCGGHVHALLGQNGAGKSTLVGVLTGRVTPDAGTVAVDGREVELGNTRVSAAAGIATVFQDLMLVPSMTGLENIALALHVSASRATRALVRDIAIDFELPVELDVPVRELELPQRQRIELLRALSQRPSFLLLDEPTSLLPPTLIDVFLGKVRDLADRGLAVLLITHRLDEARSIADCVTILRDGRVISEYDRESLPSNRELALAMIGTEVVENATLASPRDDLVLEAEDVSVVDDSKHEVVRGVSVHIRAGEILGIAGVDGNGQLEILETFAGLRGSAHGTIRFRGEDITWAAHEERWHKGIEFVSGDRRRDGVVPTFSIADHFSYALGKSAAGPLRSVLKTYGVKPADPSFRADQLSGGNQQKLMIARACLRDPLVLLASYPTHGLDVQATTNIHDILVEHAGRGRGILFTSSDLDELLTVSHRVIVMNRGRIVGEQARASFDKQELAEWFTRSA